MSPNRTDQTVCWPKIVHLFSTTGHTPFDEAIHLANIHLVNPLWWHFSSTKISLQLDPIEKNGKNKWSQNYNSNLKHHLRQKSFFYWFGPWRCWCYCCGYYCYCCVLASKSPHTRTSGPCWSSRHFQPSRVPRFLPAVTGNTSQTIECKRQNSTSKRHCPSPRIPPS